MHSAQTGKLRLTNGTEVQLTQRGQSVIQGFSGSVNLVNIRGPESCLGFLCRSCWDCCCVSCCCKGCCDCKLLMPLIETLPPAFVFNEAAGERDACFPDWCTGWCLCSPCACMAYCEFCCCYVCCPCRATSLTAGDDLAGDYMSARYSMVRHEALRERVTHLHSTTGGPGVQQMLLDPQQQQPMMAQPHPQPIVMTQPQMQHHLQHPHPQQWQQQQPHVYPTLG